MCGICGVFEKQRDNRRLVTAMHEMIAHRGPDAAAVHCDGDVTLGHRRLSIIDLSTGDQPIFNESRSLGIIYNGEIYNYRELREELREKGYHFRTTSDTEVILQLYEDQGTASFARLNGIFAFAILDKRAGTTALVLARDHFGIKPLHYHAGDGRFVFASEQKAILLHPDVPRRLNHTALHQHINLRYTQSAETLFAGIHRLPPAHYMTVREGRVVEVRPYWRLDYRIDRHKSEEDWLGEIRHHLKQAVSRQLVSDVPIGVYLSGGMDSGSIVAMMRESGVETINTFTLGFNEPTDENDEAALTARHYDTTHHNLRMALNPMRLMPEVIWHAEEPKINLLQGFLMSRFVAQHVKVVLGGLGGDELFSGYDIHRFIYPFNGPHRWVSGGVEHSLLAPLSRLTYALQRRLSPMAFDEYRRGVQMMLATGNIKKFYLILRNVWDYDCAHWSQIYAADFVAEGMAPVQREFDALFAGGDGLSALEQVYDVEFRSKMVNDYLLTEDRMSMSNSVEERVPFLDLDLVKLGFSIPSEMKMKGGQTKSLLRRAMAPYLPDRIVNKKKWGFTINPYLQFQKDLKDTAERILTAERINRDGIFNYAYIRRILDARPHPRMRWHYNYIWVLVGFYIWKQMYIDSDDFQHREFDLARYF